jgi:AraC-like DNA-binding protein
MLSVSVDSFTDPDAYFAAVRTAAVEGVVTARGDYRAELTNICLPRVVMSRGDDSLARVVNASVSPPIVGIHFATDPDQPASCFGGIELPQDAVMAIGSGSQFHLRSSAASRWGDVCLAAEDLAAAAATILGRAVTPTLWHPVRPPAPVLYRLRNLHAAADNLARTAPDLLLKPAVARAIDEALVEAMVACLAAGERIDGRRAHRHHATVMRRLEAALQANPEGPMYLADLCAATGASYWTLRASCQEQLGMSPKRYLLLRRMNLARQALGRADPKCTTVTEIAGNYGFWELGRFSAVYRGLFGESPSTTLRRAPEMIGVARGRGYQPLQL